MFGLEVSLVVFSLCILVCLVLFLLLCLGKMSWLGLPRCVKQFDFYLAGPMTNYENKNKDMFFKVATLMRKQGYTVFNPGEVNDDGMSFSECMAVDLNAVINHCKGIAFLPGWRNSVGSNVEAFVASVCGKESYQTRLIKNGTRVGLKKISLAKRTLPYKIKRRI